jgi:hypothetical protein
MSISRFRLIGLMCAMASTLACHVGPTAPKVVAGRPRVLFIGNSLTYSNDLPAMYAALAKLAGDTVQVAMVAKPDYALEDHWLDGEAPRWLREQKWDYVVMQQGSSALPASQVNLRSWSIQFAPLIRAAGAEPVLFMVWPQESRLFDFPNVLESYRNAATAVNGIFAPAGDAWVAHGDVHSFYSDGLHPNVRGTYLAACVLLARTRGISPMALPFIIPGANVSAEDVQLLQQAANTALARNSARGGAEIPLSSSAR